MQSLTYPPFTGLLLLLLLLVVGPETKAGAWPSDTLQIPRWTRHYDSFRRSEDVFIVSKGDKKGVVCLAGKAITKLEYDTILPFREGMAIVEVLQRGRFKTAASTVLSIRWENW
jgi:hypothetical protein